ncbi:hypothetical protein Tco_0917505 [Tanacetum coccineum]
MWIAIERLQQGESLNKQDVKTNLFWEFDKFISRDGESIKSYYSRFYKMMNEMIRNKLDIANMQVNEARSMPLRAEHDEWLHDTDEEPDEQELEAHYMYMTKIQEVLQTTYDNFGPTYDAEPLEKIVQIIIFIVDS